MSDSRPAIKIEVDMRLLLVVDAKDEREAVFKAACYLAAGDVDYGAGSVALVKRTLIGVQPAGEGERGE